MPDAALTRTERLLALLLINGMNDAPQQDKVLMLSRAGFTNQEVGDLVGATAAVVGQTLYTARKGKTKKKAKPKAKRK